MTFPFTRIFSHDEMRLRLIGLCETPEQVKQINDCMKMPDPSTANFAYENEPQAKDMIGFMTLLPEKSYMDDEKVYFAIQMMKSLRTGDNETWVGAFTIGLNKQGNKLLYVPPRTEWYWMKGPFEIKDDVSTAVRVDKNYQTDFLMKWPAVKMLSKARAALTDTRRKVKKESSRDLLDAGIALIADSVQAQSALDASQENIVRLTVKLLTSVSNSEQEQ